MGLEHNFPEMTPPLTLRGLRTLSVALVSTWRSITATLQAQEKAPGAPIHRSPLERDILEKKNCQPLLGHWAPD